MKNSDKLIVNLIESKIKEVEKNNIELLPLINDAEKLNDLEYKTLKRLGKKQGEINQAISVLLKTFK